MPINAVRQFDFFGLDECLEFAHFTLQQVGLGGDDVSTLGMDSPTAQAFGATVELTTGSLAMCLVNAYRDPAAALNAVGARVLATLSPTRVIAIVDMAVFAQLRSHPDIASAGSISVDPQRFTRFQQIVGLG